MDVEEDVSGGFHSVVGVGLGHGGESFFIRKNTGPPGTLHHGARSGKSRRFECICVRRQTLPRPLPDTFLVSRRLHLPSNLLRASLSVLVRHKGHHSAQHLDGHQMRRWLSRHGWMRSRPCRGRGCRRRRRRRRRRRDGNGRPCRGKGWGVSHPVVEFPSQFPQGQVSGGGRHVQNILAQSHGHARGKTKRIVIRRKRRRGGGRGRGRT